MSEPRPYNERPAARPVPPAAVPGGSVPPNAEMPPKKGMGCFGIGCLGVIVLAILIPVIGNTIGSASNGAGSSTTSGRSSSGNSGGGSGGSSDPIEQARVVLRGAYSYDTVKAATDAALAATNTPISNENYSRAWSAVLKVTDNLTGVAPMDVMECVAELGPSSRMDFPDTTAICATTIHLDG